MSPRQFSEPPIHDPRYTVRFNDRHAVYEVRDDEGRMLFSTLNKHICEAVVDEWTAKP